MLDQPLKFYVLAMLVVIAFLIMMPFELFMGDDLLETFGGFVRIALWVIALLGSIWLWQDIVRRRRRQD